MESLLALQGAWSYRYDVQLDVLYLFLAGARSKARSHCIGQTTVVTHRHSLLSEEWVDRMDWMCSPLCSLSSLAQPLGLDLHLSQEEGLLPNYLMQCVEVVMGRCHSHFLINWVLLKFHEEGSPLNYPVWEAISGSSGEMMTLEILS